VLLRESDFAKSYKGRKQWFQWFSRQTSLFS